MRHEAEIYYEGAKAAIQPLSEAFLDIERKHGALLGSLTPKVMALLHILQEACSASLALAEERAQELYPEVPLDTTTPAKPISAEGGFYPGTEKER